MQKWLQTHYLNNKDTSTVIQTLSGCVLSMGTVTRQGLDRYNCSTLPHSAFLNALVQHMAESY